MQYCRVSRPLTARPIAWPAATRLAAPTETLERSIGSRPVNSFTAVVGVPIFPCAIAIWLDTSSLAMDSGVPAAINCAVRSSGVTATNSTGRPVNSARHSRKIRVGHQIRPRDVPCLIAGIRRCQCRRSGLRAILARNIRRTTLTGGGNQLAGSNGGRQSRNKELRIPAVPENCIAQATRFQRLLSP